MDDKPSSDRTLEDLEWARLREAIARHASSDLGREALLQLSPAPDQQVAATRLSVMREVLELHAAGSTIPAGMFRDVRPTLARVVRGAIASGPEFRELSRLLSVGLELDKFGEKHEQLAPTLGRVLSVEPAISGLRRSIDDKIDEDGTVRDDASPALARSRAALSSQRVEIQRRLEELIGRYREALQDGYYAERDGRYVLPVRADAPFRVDGIVLGTSGSGATLYVEPVELGKLGNKLRMLLVDVEREEAKVLSQLGLEVEPLSEEIEWVQGVCIRGDLLRACAAHAAEIGSRVVDFDEPGAMTVFGARHPLLALSGIDVVPSDLSVAPGRALVLSGPNAGGKTVALKTLGLLALMQATGLPVPTRPESKIGFFDEVLSDIGDDQSLSMSLSTFSGHVRRVKEILDDAGHGTLVLFDELMSGTDPDEGAVLAIATLEGLVDSGAAVCATTHYEPLKVRANHDDRLENGAVGFDFQRMEPTFRVEMGRPGASSAIIVAERFGLPRHLTERALTLLPETIAKRRLTNLDLEEKTLALEEERRRLEEVREEQERINRRLKLELERTEDARRRDLSRESDALRIEVREARNEIRRIRGDLKRAAPLELGGIEGALDKAARTVALGSPVERDLRPASQSAQFLAESDVQVGMAVAVAGFQEPGEVLALPRKGQVQVRLGVMKMSVALKDLARPGKGSGDKGNGGRAKPKQASPSVQALVQPSTLPAPLRTQDATLDLRGMRVEEGLTALDHFIDELLRRQEFGGFVLHGHGTGAMKEAVRSYLGSHDCIRESRPAERDEGGDAFTILWLMGS